MQADRRLFLGASLAALASGSPAIAQIPSVGDIARRARERAEQAVRDTAESAVAHSLFPLEEDASQMRAMARALDHLDFGAYRDMSSLTRTATGGFRLRPGAWTYNAESYCLKSGTYERTGGTGYRSGVLTGRVGTHVRAILAGAYAHPEVSRNDIQMLLWGILAGVPIREQPAGAQSAATALLTAAQIGDLNGGPGGWVPQELSSRALRELPPDVRAAYDAQRRMRDVARRPRTSFTDMENIAVLRGTPERTADDIPAGRWNYHPDGFFIRYDSESYSRTTVQIVVGEPHTIRRDSRNRIVEVRLGDGAYVRTSYRDVDPLRIADFPGIAAYQFARVEFGEPGAGGGMQRAVFENQSYCWVSERTRRAERLIHYAEADADFCSDVAYLQYAQGGYDWSGAYERASDARERAEYYRDRYRAATDPVTDEDINNVTDLGHYREGLGTLRGSEGERIDWIGRTHERLARALARATEIINGLPGDDRPTYEPYGEAGLPSSRGAQRRGLSGRSW